MLSQLMGLGFSFTIFSSRLLLASLAVRVKNIIGPTYAQRIAWKSNRAPRQIVPSLRLVVQDHEFHCRLLRAIIKTAHNNQRFHGVFLNQ